MKQHPLWTCSRFIRVGEVEIPLNLPDDGYRIERNLPLPRVLYRVLKGPFRLRNRLLVDGYIERGIGRWLRRYSREDDVVLDVGCGDMRLYKYIPRNSHYYAFDISMNELFLKEELSGRKANLHFAFASAMDIPLASDTVNIVTCLEVLEHIAGYMEAVREIWRVIKPNGLFLVSIPNNYSYKYAIKGQHQDHHHAWKYEEFSSMMKSSNFDLVESYMIGRWLRLPLWLTKTSYQLPLSSKNEFYNSNFLYAFRARKGSAEKS
jgi:SAM-dependent methyltransferase